jgi:putative alpha-1,2-mannosidase
MAGGELRFTMQVVPNKAWATTKAMRPYSMTGY